MFLGLLDCKTGTNSEVTIGAVATIQNLPIHPGVSIDLIKQCEGWFFTVLPLPQEVDRFYDDLQGKWVAGLCLV